MKYLSKQYEAVIHQAEGVVAWLNEKQGNAERQIVELETRKASSTLIRETRFGSLFIFVISTIALLFSDLLPHHLWREIIGWVVITSGLSAFLCGVISWAYTPTSIAAERALKKLEADRFYVRAKLILQAIQDYQKHCAKYRAWFDAVDNGIAPSDEELADRHHAFIVNAHEVLEKAVSNFLNVASLFERRETFQRNHPELTANPENTALSDLVTQLNHPVEMPPDVAFPDPRAALEYEEALAEIASDLDGSELTAKIDQAVASARLTPKAS